MEMSCNGLIHYWFVRKQKIINVCIWYIWWDGREERKRPTCLYWNRIKQHETELAIIFPTVSLLDHSFSNIIWNCLTSSIHPSPIFFTLSSETESGFETYVVLKLVESCQTRMLYVIPPSIVHVLPLCSEAESKFEFYAFWILRYGMLHIIPPSCSYPHILVDVWS